jgi:hypothetical protein
MQQPRKRVSSRRRKRENRSKQHVNMLDQFLLDKRRVVFHLSHLFVRCVYDRIYIHAARSPHSHKSPFCFVCRALTREDDNDDRSSRKVFRLQIPISIVQLYPPIICHSSLILQIYVHLVCLSNQLPYIYGTGQSTTVPLQMLSISVPPLKVA